MTDVEKIVRDVEPCPECGGSGRVMSIGCCGNFTDHGECRGHCSIPTEYLCSYCVGLGFDPLHRAALEKEMGE